MQLQASLGGGWISFWYMESYVSACVESNNFSFLKSQCLRDELKYVEGLQPTSKCCKEYVYLWSLKLE
ncbi:hypothetical protein QL285_082449 [Trifolium repens]|nr:hypothetical protein QL285_082449 [Trifolium repens]